MPPSFLISSCRRLIRTAHSSALRKQIVLDSSQQMVSPMSVAFLGTSSGGGPTDNRNCSSLVCDFFEGNNLWMVDCAEGTTRQFTLQPSRQNVPRIKINNIAKLFVTHMHADHIMGIPTLLRNLLRAPRLDAPTPPSYAIENRKVPTIHIYGPCGLRSFIRQNLKITFTRCDENYVVHELLTNDDTVTPCNPPLDVGDPKSGSDCKDFDILHCNEIPGRDIMADDQGLWRDIASQIFSKQAAEISVHAGPILHREPCIGYVFDETTSPRRKVVVLGDTYDPSPIIPLCEDPTPSLLIHEATDSTISEKNDNRGKLAKRKLEDIMKTTLARGHSTPMMAGEFAKRINAQKLVLNHIGSRFPAPALHDTRRSYAHYILDDLEAKATAAWNSPSGAEAIVALDFMRVLVPDSRQSTKPSYLDNLSTSLPPSLPTKPPPQSNASIPVQRPVSTNMMQPPATWSNQNGPSTNSFHHSAPPTMPMPVQATGQPGYYTGQPMGFDPMQQAQSFLAYAQMVQHPQQLAVATGNNHNAHIIIEDAMNAITAMGMGMFPMNPMGTGLAGMLMQGMGHLGPYEIDPRLGIIPPIPIPTPVDAAAAMATLSALGGPGASVGIPVQDHQPRMDVTGDLEGLEHDPVIARSIAAASIQYENQFSESRDDVKRKIDENHD